MRRRTTFGVRWKFIPLVVASGLGRVPHFGWIVVLALPGTVFLTLVLMWLLAPYSRIAHRILVPPVGSAERLQRRVDALFRPVQRLPLLGRLARFLHEHSRAEAAEIVAAQRRKLAPYMQAAEADQSGADPAEPAGGTPASGALRTQCSKQKP
jgi:hypothetical protein